MTRTTEQWEQLLEGTTPGPWEVETIPELRYANGETWEELGHHVVLGESLEDGPLFATYEQTVEDAKQYQDNEANIHLAAHAPAAVAEVIRLRKAIAELAEEERVTADDEFYPTHLRDLCRAFADDLARILEGDTDE